MKKTRRSRPKKAPKRVFWILGFVPFRNRACLNQKPTGFALLLLKSGLENHILGRNIPVSYPPYPLDRTEVTVLASAKESSSSGAEEEQPTTSNDNSRSPGDGTDDRLGLSEVKTEPGLEQAEEAFGQKLIREVGAVNGFASSVKEELEDVEVPAPARKRRGAPKKKTKPTPQPPTPPAPEEEEDLEQDNGIHIKPEPLDEFSAADFALLNGTADKDAVDSDEDTADNVCSKCSKPIQDLSAAKPLENGVANGTSAHSEPGKGPLLIEDFFGYDPDSQTAEFVVIFDGQVQEEQVEWTMDVSGMFCMEMFSCSGLCAEVGRHLHGDRHRVQLRRPRRPVHQVHAVQNPDR